MSSTLEAQLKSYIIVPIGSRRFSLAAESVIELISLGKLQKFPHRTSWISGVIVRRNRVVPVCDVSRLLGETNASIGRFYLVAEWDAGNTRDWCAIPVAGECELASAEATLRVEANTENEEPHIAGFLQVGEDRIQVLDLAKLIRDFRTPSEADVSERGS
ncbi:MAG: chemotaxis protein CheW [Candidatus Acidiferrales bacterium]